MTKIFLGQSAAKLFALAALVFALPQLADAQLIIHPSTYSDDVVSLASPGVTHTGAGIKHSMWYNATGSVISSVNTGGTTNSIYHFEGFCWDGGVPGYSWRLREAATTGPDPTVLTTKNQNLSLKFDPDKNSLTNNLINNPDIAVGHVPLDPDNVTDSRGFGDFFLVATYEFPNALTGKVEVYLDITLIRNPANYFAEPATSAPFPFRPAYSETKVVNNKLIGVGTNPNVDVSWGNEFALTYQNNGSIYGLLGKLYVPGLFLLDATTNRRTSLGLNADLSTVFVAGYTAPNVTPFVVAPANATTTYTQPDVALTDWFESPSIAKTASRMFFTYVKKTTPAGGTLKYDIGVKAMTMAPTPASVVLPSPTPNGTVNELQSPRITACVGAPAPYMVTFQETLPAIGADCDLPQQPALSLIHTRKGFSNDVMGSTVPQTSLTARNYINRCTAQNSNTEPVIACNNLSAGVAILWEHVPVTGSDPNLLGSDILAHRVNSEGIHPGGIQSHPYQTESSHVRVNTQFAGNQIAPSVACEGSTRTVSAWFDAEPNSETTNFVVAHDQPEGSGATLRPAGSSGPLTAPAPAASITRAIQVVPNPSGTGGVLNVDLMKNERIVEINVIDSRTGQVVNRVAAGALPTETKAGSRAQVPLRLLLPAAASRGLYLLKVTTNQSVSTTRFDFNAAE
ncbi:MAG: T9SS type A sorting domain-containing protein [Hymenobacteraceae bacterium]|nr:T9SS type A sorting domain-containing protein [Hymenobacteraceae bacterium]